MNYSTSIQSLLAVHMETCAATAKDHDQHNWFDCLNCEFSIRRIIDGIPVVATLHMLSTELPQTRVCNSSIIKTNHSSSFSWLSQSKDDVWFDVIIEIQCKCYSACLIRTRREINSTGTDAEFFILGGFSLHKEGDLADPLGEDSRKYNDRQ